jgi:hypothetical protein
VPHIYHETTTDRLQGMETVDDARRERLACSVRARPGDVIAYGAPISLGFSSATPAGHIFETSIWLTKGDDAPLLVPRERSNEGEIPHYRTWLKFTGQRDAAADTAVEALKVWPGDWPSDLLSWYFRDFILITPLHGHEQHAMTVAPRGSLSAHERLPRQMITEAFVRSGQIANANLPAFWRP